VLEPLSIAGEEATGAIAGRNEGTLADIEVKLLNEAKVSGGTVGGLLGINTGSLSNLTLRMDAGTRVEAGIDGAVVGGAIGDNTGDLAPGQFELISTGGSVGSAMSDAIVGGVIGKQDGDLSDYEVVIDSNYT